MCGSGGGGGGGAKGLPVPIPAQPLELHADYSPTLLSGSPSAEYLVG